MLGKIYPLVVVSIAVTIALVGVAFVNLAVANLAVANLVLANIDVTRCVFVFPPFLSLVQADRAVHSRPLERL